MHGFSEHEENTAHVPVEYFTQRVPSEQVPVFLKMQLRTERLGQVSEFPGESDAPHPLQPFSDSQVMARHTVMVEPLSQFSK